jgi:hypothetical protein
MANSMNPDRLGERLEQATDYWCLPMDSLARLITREWNQEAYAEWRHRYGHDFPVYAIVKGQVLKL